MSIRTNILAILSASIDPLTAREIRKALGDTDSPENIGKVLCNLERSGHVAVIRDERPYTYVANTGGQNGKPATGPDAAVDKPAPANGAARAKSPSPRTASDLRKSIDRHIDCGEAAPNDVSINRTHLRTLTCLAMHSSAPLDHDAYVAIVAGARRTLL